MTSHPFPRSRFTSLLAVSTFPSNSFLCDASVYDVDPAGSLVGQIGSPVERLAERAAASGSAEVSTDPEFLVSDASSAIAIPVFQGQRIVSIVVLSSKRLREGEDDVVGVFEVWEPLGPYEELALKGGYYGRMERFHTVSSFVRFEKGNGLPGQVWQQSTSVIHDDLSNHPGFLRAAGASADLLKTAIGIPVAAEHFHGAAVLISSAVSPIASVMEVWQAEDDGFTLVGGAHADADSAFLAISEGTRLEGDLGLPALAKARGTAVLSDDIEQLMAGRRASATNQPTAGLAIPFFRHDKLTSVALLLF